MKKTFKLIFFAVMLGHMTYAQQVIQGTVSDINGPLPGANILEQGTQNGVSTDFDGNFTITVSNENSIIEVSYTGFVSQEISVGNQSSIDIVLEEDSQLLQEVVVTALGFTESRDKQGATTSIVSTQAVGNPCKRFERKSRWTERN